MSENQSDCFFSTLEHATVPVRATKLAEVETGFNRAMFCVKCFKFFGQTVKTARVGRYRPLHDGRGMMGNQGKNYSE